MWKRRRSAARALKRTRESSCSSRGFLVGLQVPWFSALGGGCCRGKWVTERACLSVSTAGDNGSERHRHHAVISPQHSSTGLVSGGSTRNGTLSGQWSGGAESDKAETGAELVDAQFSFSWSGRGQLEWNLMRDLYYTNLSDFCVLIS